MFFFQRANVTTHTFFTILIRLIKVKPVGRIVEKSFIPLTEVPPPRIRPPQVRRHMEDECTKKPGWREVHDGPRVDIIGDYYDEDIAKTVATVIIPDHIDGKITLIVHYFSQSQRQKYFIQNYVNLLYTF